MLVCKIRFFVIIITLTSLWKIFLVTRPLHNSTDGRLRALRRRRSSDLWPCPIQMDFLWAPQVFQSTPRSAGPPCSYGKSPNTHCGHLDPAKNLSVSGASYTYIYSSSARNSALRGTVKATHAGSPPWMEGRRRQNSTIATVANLRELMAATMI